MRGGLFRKKVLPAPLSKKLIKGFIKQNHLSKLSFADIGKAGMESSYKDFDCRVAFYEHDVKSKGCGIIQKIVTMIYDY